MWELHTGLTPPEARQVAFESPDATDLEHLVPSFGEVPSIDRRQQVGISERAGRMSLRAVAAVASSMSRSDRVTVRG